MTTSALYLISLATMLMVESMPWWRLAQCHSWVVSTREKSFKSWTIFDAADAFLRFAHQDGDVFLEKGNVELAAQRFDLAPLL